MNAQGEDKQSASREESSPEPDDAGTLISDFQTLQLLENKCLFFNPSILWYFVMAACDD